MCPLGTDYGFRNATLSLAMIVRNEGDTIERVLGGAKAFCDEMIVVDTGSTDDTVAKAEAMGARVHHFTWVDDFSAARNFSFTHCTQDWILWLDGDDVITSENQQRISELKRLTLNDALDAVYLRYVYPPFTQWRERIVRRALFGKTLEWRNAIHECIDGIDASNAAYFQDISINHQTPPDRHILKIGRNIAILRKEYERGVRDQRTLYIYACECLHNHYKEEGEKVIEAFFRIAQYSPYKYEIYHKMYDFYMKLGEPERALYALTRAIAEDPKCAEAYYKLGRHVLDEKDDPRGAIPLLRTAAAIVLPAYGEPEIEAYTYGPLQALCRSYFRLEDYRSAQEMAKRALQYNPPSSDWLTQLLDYDANFRPAEPLPSPWQEWLEGNALEHAIPNPVLIRILEENGFTPGQIITGLRTVKAKKLHF